MPVESSLRPFYLRCFLSLPRTLSSSMASATQTAAAGEAGNEVEILERIQSHQEKAARLPPVEEIRTVLANSTRGMLSTFSQKYDGYPSGSLVDFACDSHGSPILAISSLSARTKDLLANPKFSLLVAKDPEDRTDPVTTLNEFSGEEYAAAEVDPISEFSEPISTHMNKDHAVDTKLIVQHSTTIPVESAHMLDVDRLGFYVKACYKGRTYKLLFPYSRPATAQKDVKTLVIEMLQAAKSKGN